MAQPQTSTPPPSNPPTYSNAIDLQRALDEGKISVDEVLQRLQVRQLLTEAIKKEDELEAKVRAQSSMLKSIEEGEMMRLQGQENCPHRKENGRTALAGQTDSKGQIILICLHCQKEFRDYGKVPEHLRPAPDLIGG